MKVFFSFYYTKDYFRAKQVMQIIDYKPNGIDYTGFIPDNTLDEMALKGLPHIYTWIESEVLASDVVIVLIGKETAGRHFVEYEIATALKASRPIFGITIHSLKDQIGAVGQKGNNPLLPVFKIYDAVKDQASLNLIDWIHEAYNSCSQYYQHISPFLMQQVKQTRGIISKN